MTRVLVAYDGSPAADAALRVTAALFPAATATLATVQPPTPTLEAAALARVAVPDSMIRDGVDHMRLARDREARAVLDAGAAVAQGVGLELLAAPIALTDISPWRALRALARELNADALACGTRGHGAVSRALVGSTATALLHHAERPLLVVPAGVATSDGPVVVGYDGSEHARAALRFVSRHLARRRMVVAHARQTPIHPRFEEFAEAHDVYLEGLGPAATSPEQDIAQAGARYAFALGLSSLTAVPESPHGERHALLRSVRAERASAIVVGSHGRGSLGATVLGSMAAGLVHAAECPVLVVPPAHGAGEVT